MQFRALRKAPGDTRRSNCLFYALWKYWRYGGYVVAMQSSYGWWPHFVWSPDMKTFTEFVPAVRLPGLSPSVWFNGSVRDWTPGRPGSHDRLRRRRAQRS